MFQELVLANDSGERPRDQKQVRNQAQTMLRPATLGKGSNVADEFVALLGALHNHPFTKVATVHQEQHLIVISYTVDQIKDLSRFCSTNTPPHMKTVLRIDRTFNLGSCYVTTCVYRNMSVVCKTHWIIPFSWGQ